MTAAVAAPKISSARLIVCYAAILGTLPYLALKASWVTGGTLGLRDPSFVDSGLMRFANLTVHVFWALGPGGMSARVMDGVFALLSVLAAASLMTVSRGRFWPRLVLVWTGAGAMAGWGAWGLFTALSVGPLSSAGPWQVPVLAVQVIGAVVMMTSILRRLPHAA